MRYQLLLLANVNGALGAVIVSPVLESLTGPFGGPGTQLGLMMTLFTAPSVVGIPVAGAIADRYGRKPVLITALILFGAGGTAIAFTTDYTVVLALRAVQGIGYSGILPIVIPSTGDIYDGAEETSAHGLRFSSSGIAQTIFPLLTGVLMAFSWRYPFFCSYSPSPSPSSCTSISRNRRRPG